jgi:hypothetical protein
MTSLKSQQIKTLPLHDAHVISFGLSLATSPQLNIRLELEINFEESMAELNTLGLSSRRIAFVFPESSKFIADIKKDVHSIGTLDHWEVKSSSRISDGPRSSNRATSPQLSGHILSFSSGSKLEIWADSVFVEEITNQKQPAP